MVGPDQAGIAVATGPVIGARVCGAAAKMRTAETLPIRITACSDSSELQHDAVAVDGGDPAAEPLALDEDLDRARRCRGRG